MRKLAFGRRAELRICTHYKRSSEAKLVMRVHGGQTPRVITNMCIFNFQCKQFSALSVKI